MPVAQMKEGQPPSNEAGVGSFTDYFEAAMRRAHYEIMENDEGFFGTIPGLKGLWGHGTSLEECRRELRSTLEDWVLVGLHLGDELPVLDGVDLNPQALE